MDLPCPVTSRCRADVVRLSVTLTDPACLAWRADPTCEWCADEFRKFQAPGRGEVDVCPFIGFRFPNVNGDQCTSSFFPGGDNEEPGGATDFTDCTAGPGRTYPTEASLPEWCNCTSDMFQRVVDGTTYCELDSRFNSIFKQAHGASMANALRDP